VHRRQDGADEVATEQQPGGRDPVAGGDLQHLVHVDRGAVVGEQRSLEVIRGTVVTQVAGDCRDRVSRVVHACAAVAVAVHTKPDVRGNFPDGCPAPGVAGATTDAELHRPGGPG
jgi:hypothetical protein